MLNSMRGSGQSKTMWVIMALLMFGLTFGFGLDSLRGANVTSIGSVGDEPIEIDAYGRAYQNATLRLSQQFGRNLTPAELEQLGVQEQVLDAVSGQAALDNETAKLGLSVGDDLVRDSIVNSQQFQGLDGTFDQEAYAFYLERQVGLSAGQFEARLRKENARSLLQNSVIGGVDADNTLALTFINFARQERSFEWVAISEDNLTQQIPEPSEEELEAFYNAQSTDYMTPQTRNLTYVWLNPTDLLDTVEVSEDQIRESYELQASRFNREEQRIVDRVVFPSVEDAQAARDRLDSGSVTFSQVVAERGLEDADVELGEVSRGSLSEAAATLLFEQTEPGVVGPVESTLGPALFRINAVIQADTTPFEEAREELRNELAGESARRLVADLVGEIDDELAAGVRLEELNTIDGLKIGDMAFFDGVEDALAGYPSFRNAALTVKESDFPEVTDLSDGGVFALRLNDIVEPTQIPFSDVKERVGEDWHAAEVKKEVRALAESLEPSLSEGGELTIAEASFEAVDGIARSAFVEGIPRSAIAEVFEMNLGEVAVVDHQNSALLLRVTNITDFDPDQEGNDVELNRVKEQIDAQVSLDILDYFSDALQADAGVSLDRNIINQVNLQLTGGAAHGGN